ncbi:CocE/NonD family hydrolase C-terminal non-catalytic domain-containing protein [Streptomyces sp. SCSIO 30461]|uniref:CocE/NonD family hydrolase C-terminal non-catalytic domain-containing protein n=1 Tax=Streptomyces sp. SCSIO 30461 TaxID=3118085 RepID=UPI0030CE41A7
MVSRGWVDIRNRRSLIRQSEVVEGREYRLHWVMQPQDYVFKKGHRLGVVLISTDHDYTLRYPAGTQLSVRAGGQRHQPPGGPLTGPAVGPGTIAAVHPVPRRTAGARAFRRRADSCALPSGAR